MTKYDIKDLGAATAVLGMRITRDRKARTLKVDQEGYINRLLVSSDMQDCIPADTPEESGMKHSTLDRSDSSSSKAIKSIETEAKERSMGLGELLKLKYGSVVGSLLYAALSTRPDISHAVSTLAQFVSAPLPQHWEAAMRVLRYLKGTAHLGLIYRGQPADPSAALVLGPCSSDASWAGDVDDRRSRTGVVSKIGSIHGSTAVSWTSKKQSVVALSSAEAEYMAAGEGVREIIWLRQLLKELGRPQTSSTILLVDNQSAISIATNDVSNNRSKHIDMRHHFIREHVASGAVGIKWVSTLDQEADIFTKALGKIPFQRLRDRIMGINIDENPSKSVKKTSK